MKENDTMNFEELNQLIYDIVYIVYKNGNVSNKQIEISNNLFVFYHENEN